MRYTRPWVVWPWQPKCVARRGDGIRCELKRAHDGDHAAERGMYDIVWRDAAWTEVPRIGAVDDTY